MALIFTRRVICGPYNEYTGHVSQGIRLPYGGIIRLLILNKKDVDAGFCVYEWDALKNDFKDYPIQVSGNNLSGPTLKEAVKIATAYINKKYGLHY